MRVLIVDDNASMRSLLSTLLTAHGYEVVGSLAEGDTVMAAIDKLAPDIVCLDFVLPGRDGLDLLKEINTDHPQIDVLFMTASEKPGIREQAADAGASGFLPKPFGQKQVLDELRQVCDTRSRAAHGNQEDSGKETPGQAGKAGSLGERLKAVIVDDNSSIRLLLKGVLADLGLNIVGQAANGEEAIRVAKVHQPAVLFLDVNMPGLSGIDALPRILEASPETAVVMVTGETSRKLVQQAAGLGARGYIVKPVRPSYVENLLKKLFAS